MKERPILFSGAMVRALLAGSKTQTRRAVKQQPPAGHSFAGWCVSSTHRPDEGKATWAAGEGPFMRDCHRVKCPYGKPGDRLWVRETFLDTLGTGVEHRDESGLQHRYAFAADCVPGGYGDQARKDYGLMWKPSIHMPRAASRILLEIVSVRIERLQDISEADCWAEGIEAVDGALDDLAIIHLAKRMGRSFEDAAPTYAALWESINGAGSWDANPWVWVVEFKRVAP
jgi:hypothetical protein